MIVINLACYVRLSHYLHDPDLRIPTIACAVFGAGAGGEGLMPSVNGPSSKNGSSAMCFSPRNNIPHPKVFATCLDSHVFIVAYNNDSYRSIVKGYFLKKFSKLVN